MSMTYEIVCTRGPMKGRRWTVTPQGLKIGRAEGCEIQVGDVAAELYHCVVKLEGRKLVVSNLASANGVDVNGMSVDEAELESMDKINVGGVQFVVSVPRRGLGGAIVRAVVPIAILLGLAAAGVCFYSYRSQSDRSQSDDVVENPKPKVEMLETNHVVRIVNEIVVTTNRIVNIIDNIVVTNYVVEVRRGGALVSSRTLPLLIEPKAQEPVFVPENSPDVVDPPEEPDPVVVAQPETPVKCDIPGYTSKDLEYAGGLPYKVIDPRLALAMGGAFGGDEVRAIKYSNESYDFVHIFKEAAKPKTLVFPKKNRIQPRSGRFLIVAGGGAAFPRNMTGGGGAGGVVEKGVTISDGTAYAYVGAGGLTCGMGCNGEDSILTIAGKTYIAIGGGSGDGYSGGSGGGAGVALEGMGLQPESPTGGIGLDGTSWRTHGFKKRGGVCGGSPQYVSSISGDKTTYARGGLYYETAGRGMAGDENTGSGADGKNGGRRGGLSGGSGIIIVRYNVKIPAGKIKTEVVVPTFPARDKGVKSEWIDGVEWHYFKERNYAVIGCHAMGGSDFPDYWIPAVDTNALVGVVRIPSRIGGLPVKKIGKGALQGCVQVTKFVVPEGVSECEARAFARCPLLESVVYPRALEVLGEGQVYRSPLVNTLVFKSLPPKCITGRCPLKGVQDPINAKSHELNLTIPFEFSEQWRHWSQRESQRLIVCKDRCHRNPCYVEFSAKDLERGNTTYAGFVGEETPWASDGDARDSMDWFVEKAEDLWRKYAASGRNRVLSIPCLYSIGKGNGRGIPEHTAVIYATFMYFNAREPVYFMADIDDYAMIMVDGDVVVGLSEKGCEKNECKEPVMFASGGWHRVVVVAANDRDVGGAAGAEGGVYYSRSDNKHWHLFEANPNGKEFRITAADARRAVAEIEKARRKKQK